MLRRWLPWVLGGLGACGTNPDRNVRDEGVVMPALRLHVRSQTQPMVGPGANTVVAEAAYARGSQDGNYELFGLQGRVQIGTDPEAPLSLRLLGGLEYAWLQLEAGASSTTDQGLGPLLGLEASWHCLPPVWLYARGTSAWLAPDMTSTQLDAGLSAWPVDRCELFLAYRWWRLRREELDLFGLESDLDMRIDGLILGAGVVF